jgi:formiminotetrahydrofolate cyclodeaminase
MYLERPMKDFVEDTAARLPAPGGGSVAALVGSLGAALLCMVGNYTVGKKQYERVEGEMVRILKTLDGLKDELSSLIQEDIKAYQKYSHASGLPKDTPGQKEARNRALQLSLKEAALIPLKTSKLSLRVIDLAEEILPLGNPYLISDVGVGVSLAEAALEAAVINVQINLSYIKDSHFVEEKKREISSLLSRGRNTAEKVVKKVKDKITQNK